MCCNVFIYWLVHLCDFMTSFLEALLLRENWMKVLKIIDQHNICTHLPIIMPTVGGVLICPFVKKKVFDQRILIY